MSRRIVIFQGHPDPNSERLCRALARAYLEGARAAGHEVRSHDVATLDFPLLRTKEDFERGIDGTPEAVRPAQEDLHWADHLLIVYPLWHGIMPAVFKAFLEQLLRPGVALGYREGAFPKQLLRGKSARIVVTMGMPVIFYRWYFGGHGLKSVKRHMLGFAGVKPIRDTLFGTVENAKPATRDAWMESMRQLGRRGS